MSTEINTGELFEYIKSLPVATFLDDDSVTADQVEAELKIHQGIHDITSCRFCEIDRIAMRFVTGRL